MASKFVVITCPEEATDYRMAGMLWFKRDLDCTSGYTCIKDEDILAPLREEILQYQKDRMREGVRTYAILVED